MVENLYLKVSRGCLFQRRYKKNLPIKIILLSKFANSESFQQMLHRQHVRDKLTIYFNLKTLTDRQLLTQLGPPCALTAFSVDIPRKRVCRILIVQQ